MLRHLQLEHHCHVLHVLIVSVEDVAEGQKIRESGRSVVAKMDETVAEQGVAVRLLSTRH